MAKELIEHYDPKDLIIIGLDTDDGPEHPLYDERIRLEVDDNLVRNIQVYGIQVPVLVRKEAGDVFIVDGRQRVRAARKASEAANKAGEYGVKVPVRTVAAGDNRVAGIMISTNVIRRNDDVLTNAKKSESLMARLGDIEEVALAFGKSVTTIRNWQLLAAAGPQVHAAVRSNRLSAGAAIELVRSTKREEVEEVLDTWIEKSGGDPVSVAQAKLALANKSEEPAPEPEPSGDGQAVAPPPAAKPTKKKTTADPKKQSGIKRVWLRRALKTEAAKHLEPEQRAVLQWFATGEAEKGSWFDDFVWDAEAELESGLKAKTPRKATPKKAVLPEPEPEKTSEELDEEALLAELRDIASEPLPEEA